MAGKQFCNPPRVLHLATGDHLTGAKLADLLAECGAQLEQFSDVYRAMARLGNGEQGSSDGGDGQRVDAVLIGVDWLDTLELEIFELCARLPSAPTVWVYSGGTAGVKAALGLRLGAVSEVDAETLGPEFARLFAGSNGSAHAKIVPEEEPGDFHKRSAEPAIDDGGMGRSSKTDNVSSGDVELQEGRAIPLPWTRRSEAPVRTSPSSRVPNVVAHKSPAAPTNANADTDADEDGPLLTAQELDALIGGPGRDSDPEG